MNRLRSLAVLALTLLASLALAVPAHAAFARGYHILNVSGSNGGVYIYANYGCTGSQHLLLPGQDADSVNWDGIRVWSRSYNVLVFDDKTGNLLADRTYSAGTCSRAEGNSYRVQVL